MDAADVASLVDSSIGNPNLKPERAREIELGGEATMFQDRLHVDLTYYNKRTRDALIARTVAPSVGSGNITRFENLGAVVNRGFEFLVEGQLVQKPSVGWDVTLNGSHNTNFIADMGGADHRDHDSAAPGLSDRWLLATGVHLRGRGWERHHHATRDSRGGQRHVRRT